MSVHLFFLIGSRNRLLVVIQWAWAYYFTHQRGGRLILADEQPICWAPPEAQMRAGGDGMRTATVAGRLPMGRDQERVISQLMR
jgi:hypothetical protein